MLQLMRTHLSMHGKMQIHRQGKKQCHGYGAVGPLLYK